MSLSHPDLHTRIPTSAYIHVPFCRHRCGYCNFSLIANRPDLIDEYLVCLSTELSSVLGSPQSVRTLFIGGGTPTFLPLRQLERLFELIRHWLPLEDGGEFSCEANPLDCTSERLSLLRAAGVNRLSLGGQSFRREKLRLLERDHTGSELADVIELASRYMDNISLDLIFAAPQETLPEWQADLAQAIELPISHLSTYGLTIERGTLFFNRRNRGELVEVDESTQLAMYLHTVDTLHQADWQHYEISNFCRPGHHCRHNRVYWNSQCWWAFGPGAASFLRADSSAEISCELVWRLTTNHRSTHQYIKRLRQGQSPIAEREVLDLESWIRQRLVFGLRQLPGVDLAELDQFWGGSVRLLFEPHLSQYIDRDWLQCDGSHLRLTRNGLVISDSLWPDLLFAQSGRLHL